MLSGASGEILELALRFTHYLCRQSVCQFCTVLKYDYVRRGIVETGNAL